MLVFAGSKINLGLNVLKRRPDGYHDIETCFYPIAFGDIIEIIQANHTAIHLTGTPIPGDSDSNICLKAYILLQNDFKLPPVSIHLHKIAPVGAGLGAGSADGAHTLMLLNQIFELGLTTTQLADYASKLGSDCAFFVYNRPMMGTQRGEELHNIALDLSRYHIHIVYPGIHVSTQEAYQGITPSFPNINIESIISNDIYSWKHYLKNDFELQIFKKHPKIEAVKLKLYDLGAIYASMSGSGSAVYGIFEEKKDLSMHFEHVVC